MQLTNHKIKFPYALKLKTRKRNIYLEDEIQLPCNKKRKSDTAFSISASKEYDFHEKKKKKKKRKKRN